MDVCTTRQAFFCTTRQALSLRPTHPSSITRTYSTTHLQGTEQLRHLASDVADDPGAFLDRALVVEVRLFSVEEVLRYARQTLQAAAWAQGKVSELVTEFLMEVTKSARAR